MPSVLLSNELFIKNLEVLDDSTKRAQVMILDSKNNTLEIDTNYIRILENNIPAKILKINCPKEETAVPISSVLTIDESGSMQGNGIAIARSAATTWINKLLVYNQSSECAINAFSTYNRLLIDFTNSYYSLLSAINSLYPYGGTDYDVALLNYNESGLYLAARGKNKRVLVFLTDGMPNTMPNIDQMIQIAKKYNITIYPVVIGYDVPYFLNSLAYQTNGVAYGNVNTPEQAEKIYQQILEVAVTQKYCEITWRSYLECGDIEFLEERMNISKKVKYIAPDSMRAQIDMPNKFVNFGIVQKGFKYNTEIPLFAKNDTVTINSLKINNSQYTIKNTLNFPLKIAPGDNLLLKIEMKASNLDSLNALLEINSNTCENYFAQLVGIRKQENNILPQTRTGFGVLSLLFETNNLKSFKYLGYNLGLGVQIYLSDKISVRLSYGIDNNDTYSLLTDRTNIIFNNKVLSGSIRYNVFEKGYILGYLLPYYRYSFGSNETRYYDEFFKNINQRSHTIGLSLGAEVFTFHNLSISAEYTFGYRNQYIFKEIGFTEKVETPISEANSFFLNPKLNLILSFYIN